MLRALFCFCFFSMVSLSQAQADNYVFKYSVEVKQGSQQNQTPPAPELSSISLNSGSVSGGDWVTLYGVNFLNPAVHFGGTPVTQMSAATSTSLQVQIPAHTWGTVDVLLTNSDGQTSLLSQSFTYLNSAPTIYEIDPSSGTMEGGNLVTLTGTNFLDTPRVFLGAAEADVHYVNSSSLSIVVPAQAPGVVPVTLENPDGNAVSIPDAYRYLTNAPTLSTLSPGEVVDIGGVEVLLTGSSFLPETQVRVDGASVPTMYEASTTLRFTSPSGLTGGTAAVIAVNSDDVTSTNFLTLSFVAPTPIISTISPSSGVTLGGDTITISGNHFRTGASVFFGGIQATNTSFINTTELSVITPSYAEGSVDVMVRNPGYVEAVAPSAFTFSLPPISLTAPSTLEVVSGTSNSVYFDWAHFTNRKGLDWVGLYRAGQPNTGHIYYEYLPGLAESGTGQISGLYSFMFTHGEELELRMFRDDGYGLVATSERITVLLVSE